MRADLPGSRCRRHFIIIGAMKAGTTSLFRFLTSHPEISGSAAKELHYFSLDAARLGRMGYTADVTAGSDPASFDADLAAAVQAFQRDSGLLDDGAAGARTLTALNAGP